jgi:hypothetical protein
MSRDFKMGSEHWRVYTGAIGQDAVSRRSIIR